MKPNLKKYLILKKQFGPLGTFSISFIKFRKLTCIGTDDAFAIFMKREPGKLHLTWLFIAEKKRNKLEAGKIAKETLIYAKENDISAITGNIRTWNIPSICLAVKLGAEIQGFVNYKNGDRGYFVECKTTT